MSNQNPSFLDLIKIYWSVTWRANTLGAMIVIILFCACPFLLHFLVNIGKLEVFREYLFSLLRIPASAEEIKSLPSSLAFYFGFLGFVWDYLVFRYGFRRVLQQDIYPSFLSHIYTSYNKIFLIPLILYYFLEPLLYCFMNNDSSGQTALAIFFLLIYFTTVLALLKRTIKDQ